MGVLTSFTWFVNSGSGGDLTEAQGSRDVAISADEVESLKGSERKQGEQRKAGGPKGSVVRRQFDGLKLPAGILSRVQQII